MAKNNAAAAYAWAEQEIRRVKAAGETELIFFRDETHALDTLPPEIKDLTTLQSLDLSDTQVSDIGVLQYLTALQYLDLMRTQVSDIGALQGLTALQSLGLADTQVSDLRPIVGLDSLIEGAKAGFGLRFNDTPAVRANAEMARLDAIEDSEQRTRDTLAYLATLPV